MDPEDRRDVFHQKRKFSVPELAENRFSHRREGSTQESQLPVGSEGVDDWDGRGLVKAEDLNSP